MSSGYLANVVTEEHGFGSALCPWLITAPRGQRINVTLIDFGLASRHDGSTNGVAPAAGGSGGGNGGAGMTDGGGGGGGGMGGSGSSNGGVCHVYAKITETGATSARSSEIAICGSRSRKRNVYLSETNRLEIVISGFKLDDEPVYFLLKYEGY